MNATATVSKVNASAICSALESAAKTFSLPSGNPSPMSFIFFVLPFRQRYDQRPATERAAPARHVGANDVTVNELLRGHRRQIRKPICPGGIFAAVYDNSVAHPGQPMWQKITSPGHAATVP